MQVSTLILTGNHGITGNHEETIKFQQELIATLSADLKEAFSHAQRLENDDEQTYYTRLSSYALFDALSDLLSSALSKNPNSSKGKL